MKNVLFISMVAFSVLVSGGCKKKKEVDPCEGVTCLNGGTCNDGTCACPTGYTGANCGTQITPTKVSIDSIRVTKFPTQTSGGGTWDTFPATGNGLKPDIYCELKAAGGSSVLMTSKAQVVSNASTQTYILPIFKTDFTDLVQQYTITLLDDDDLSGSDNMGSFDFSIYSNTNNFPKKYKVSNSTNTIEFELTLSYTY